MSAADAYVPPPLHELESEVMEEIWGFRGETTVRIILEALNARADRERAYTTVMTVMRRLDEKGMLVRRREGKTDLYVPRMTREEYVEARADAEMQAVIEQYGDKALVHFARQMDRLDPARRQRLRRLSRRA